MFPSPPARSRCLSRSSVPVFFCLVGVYEEDAVCHVNLQEEEEQEEK